METPAKELDTMLRTWKPEPAAQVRERVAEVIELADEDGLDIMRARAAGEDVVGMIGEPTSR